VVTFKSLKVLDAEKPTEMGKNDDGSVAGTANSIEPLWLDWSIRMIDHSKTEFLESYLHGRKEREM